MALADDNDEDHSLKSDEDSQGDSHLSEISLHAILGRPTASTMRVKGILNS